MGESLEGKRGETEVVETMEGVNAENQVEKGVQGKLIEEGSEGRCGVEEEKGKTKMKSDDKEDIERVLVISLE